jgi:regulatory protein
MTVIDKIQKFCAYQDRSEFEVRQKLKTFPISEMEQNQIMAQLVLDKFIDDYRFALSYINGKMNAKGWGMIKIKNGLFQKGISPEIMEDVFKEIDQEKFTANLQKEIEKWKRSNTLTYETTPKLIRLLLSKGFTYNEIIKEIQ